MKLELDLPQAVSRDQLQQHIDTAAKVITDQIILMQDSHHQRVQQADDLLRLRLDGDARLLAAGDQLVEESLVARQVLVEFFGGSLRKSRS